MRLPFHGRYERFRQLQRERMGEEQEAMPGQDMITPDDAMEKGDLPAMLIAALVTIVPVCLLVLAALALVGYFFIV
ncbi:MAG: hypothetical protein MR821_04765 [Clostridiales bacterium]|nr:hypothetical protein [Clostridiales bacterium]